MIYINIPIGGAHGWGVCGKSIARELARLTPTQLLTHPFSLTDLGDEMEFAVLQRLLPSPTDATRLATMERLDGPLLQTADKQFRPMNPQVKGTYTLGYTFFEDTELLPEYLEHAKHFDRMSAGSTWCAEILRRHGMSDVVTVLQGVDPEVFFPHEPARRFFHDRFVVFSGGKFEFRKGQDLVIAAFRILAQRHSDVILVTQWSNPWHFSVNSMTQSPHIQFRPIVRGQAHGAGEMVAENGIDLRRVLMLGQCRQTQLADVYRNTDVGVFPNRAEGGTNLVLMEYMACGKPAIATASTGHADIISADNALVVGTRGEVQSSSDGAAQAVWPEPVLEDVIEKLEWAYQNRDGLSPMAQRGAETIAKLTWNNTAAEFLKLLSIP